MSHPAIRTAVCGNQYLHAMSFRQGDEIPTHRHTYDHVMQCLSGPVTVISERDGELVMNKGDVLDVPKGVAHGIVAEFGPAEVQCIHIMRWPDGSIIPFDYELTPYQVSVATAEM